MLGVILAGGSGSRLWPLSRELYPKQLLSFDDNLSLLQQTFKRLNSSINSGDILTVTNVKHYSDVKLQLDILDKNNIIVGEPIGRNTAPAIAVGIATLSILFTSIFSPCGSFLLYYLNA